MSEKIMKYDLRPEFQKYRWIHLPTQRWMLKTANALMPVIQRGRKQVGKRIRLLKGVFRDDS